ncbi:MAG: UDP-N-acetyl glucosamine 2-epimerase, partial [Gammaproteobacteria bacterium]|nr:UDP-N-acetyl glucosamine 2-epimerase [Gammaproteobacteria bacterium]
MIKIISIVGARPQFIKVAAIKWAVEQHDEIIHQVIHTGQHYDQNMSDVFFRELGLNEPDHYLGIGSASHGAMTGRMLESIEAILLAEKPDWVIVYGDTNSTLAGAIAAAKLHVPIAHVEAGLRSFNKHMPEEINRILTDQISDLLFCPTQTAVDNLGREGFDHKDVSVLNVGDVMQDSALMFAALAVSPEHFQLESSFVLGTLHRAENT